MKYKLSNRVNHSVKSHIGNMNDHNKSEDYSHLCKLSDSSIILMLLSVTGLSIPPVRHQYKDVYKRQIGALLSAIGIAGMSRLNQANVLAMSGRAIEAAGDVDILMLDKTGTITFGNRQASEFIPLQGVSVDDLADAAQLSSCLLYTSRCV